MNANRETVRQCAAYFRENPAFARMMKELRRKYEGYGRAAGTIIIKDADAAKREAARRWLEALERTNCGASQTLKRALSENEAATVANAGRAGYQEGLLPLLRADLTKQA